MIQCSYCSQPLVLLNNDQHLSAFFRDINNQISYTIESTFSEERKNKQKELDRTPGSVNHLLQAIALWESTNEGDVNRKVTTQEFKDLNRELNGGLCKDCQDRTKEEVTRRAEEVHRKIQELARREEEEDEYSSSGPED